MRTECLKLVTIGMWSHLAHQGKRETMFSEYPALEKLWKSSNKKMVAASEETRRQMEFERDFLSTLMRHYVDLVYKIPAEGPGKATAGIEMIQDMLANQKGGQSTKS